MGKAAGNATKAAELAGYSKVGAAVQGSKLLRKAKITNAIAERANADPLVADREEMQRFWTALMRGQQWTPQKKGRRRKAVPLHDRLRASELLGKSQALFVQKHEIDPGDDLASLLERLGPLQKNP